MLISNDYASLFGSEGKHQSICTLYPETRAPLDAKQTLTEMGLKDTGPSSCCPTK